MGNGVEGAVKPSLGNFSSKWSQTTDMAFDPHLNLAQANYAPALFGVAKVEGAHTAYIMEHLSPGDGWVTLHEYAKVHEDAMSRTRPQLNHPLVTTRERMLFMGTSGLIAS